MSERQEIWKEAPAASAAVVQHIGPAVQEAVQSSLFKDTPGWFVIGTAFYIRPESLTVERIRIRNPYAKSETQAEQIKALQDANLLDKNGVITQKAVDAYQALIDAQDAVADTLNFMDKAKLQKVVGYINRAYDTALNVTEPAIPAMKDATRLEMNNGLVHQIFYKIGRLNAFRDDCHLAAWKQLEMDGHHFETFSLIWDNTADSAAKLLEARPNRGYEESEWQASLDKLVEMGHLVKDSDVYKITDQGQKVRDEIELKTDDYFYQIFHNFSDEETKEFLTLLKEVKDNFTPQPEPEA